MIKPDIRYEFNLLKKNDIRYIIGVDEVGRGPLAGPVVTCAVVIDLYTKIIDDVADSKLLSATKRLHLDEKIRETVISFGINEIENTVIDKKGIVGSIKRCMEKSIKKCDVDLEKCLVLIDGKALRGFEFRYISMDNADKRLYSVAAASIIAKVYRDNLMNKYHEQFPAYDFINNKGYGTRKHIEAIRKFGLCPIHRVTFCKHFK